MSNIVKVGVVLSLVMVMAGVAGADPFSSQWNWLNERVQGKVKEVVEQSRSKTVDTYNEKGQKTKAESFDKDGKPRYVTTLEYNKDGDLYKVIFQKAGADKPMYVETAEYNSKGIIKSVTNVRAGKTNKSEAFEYDKKKRLKAIKIMKGSDLMVWNFEFDDKGNCLGGIITSGDKQLGGAKCLAYHKGNPANMGLYRGERLTQTSTLEYKYDKFGNWIEKTEQSTTYSKSGDKVNAPKTKKRTITYYPEKKKLN
jgi:hypothetical protein